MKKLLFLSLLLASNVHAASYCESFKWDSQTKFEGTVGEPGNTGIVTYLGHNPTGSDNVGTYEFKSKDMFVMEFAGEPRHVCQRYEEMEWNCRMGRWFRYALTCEF